jgi:hypothetical protein
MHLKVLLTMLPSRALWGTTYIQGSKPFHKRVGPNISVEKFTLSEYTISHHPAVRSLSIPHIPTYARSSFPEDEKS